MKGSILFPPVFFYASQLQIMLYSTLLFKKVASAPGGVKNISSISWGQNTLTNSRDTGYTTNDRFKNYNLTWSD